MGGSVWTEPPPLHSVPPGLRAKGGFGVVSIHDARSSCCALSSRQVWAPSRLGWPPLSVKLQPLSADRHEARGVVPLRGEMQEL